MQPENLPTRIYLDLSLLIYAASHERTPSGIVRVELAYAEYFLTSYPEYVEFVVLDAFGRLDILDGRRATDIVAAISKYWRADISSRRAHWRIIWRAHRIYAELLFQRWGSLGRTVARRNERATFVISSQLHMERPQQLERLKRSGKVRIVYFVHDILPVAMPEYFPSAYEGICRRTMSAAARIADVVVANSRETARAFRQTFAPHRDPASIVVAPLGVATDNRPLVDSQSPMRAPYFVMIGTIEPRKNHLLILNIWRVLRTKHGDAAPHLVIVGARGWENENVVDMLERSPMLRSFVHEQNLTSDDRMAGLLKGACALLLPSFNEGFGLPLAEALALGVPALCSDIDVLREIGGSVPEYLNPLDGPAWQSAIERYAVPDSLERKAQLERLIGWSAPTWQAHFATVLPHLEKPC